MPRTHFTDWNIPGLLYSYGVAATLVLSYLWAPTRALG